MWIQVKMTNFYCEKCDCSYSRKDKLKEHLLTRKHLLSEDEKKQLSKEKLQKNFHEWKDSILPELKIPALQLCSLSIVLMVIVAVEKGQGGSEEMYEPLNSDVEVFTYNDFADKAEE